MIDLKFNCPNCQQSLDAPQEMLGQVIDCPSCNTRFQIPPREPQKKLSLGISTQQSTPANVTRACPFCGEGILPVALKCKHCGEFLDPALRFQTQAATNRNGDETTLKRIHDWENLSSVFWIIWGIIQCLTLWLVIAGVWNIVNGIALRKRLPRILARNSDIPSLYEPIIGLVIFGVINLLFGGVIGVAFIIFDFKIRDEVLKHKHLFNKMSNQSATR